MLVTRSSSLPTLLDFSRHQGSDAGTDERGRRFSPNGEAGRQATRAPQPAASSPIPQSGALAYSPVLISLSATDAQGTASRRLSQRSGADAYQAIGRTQAAQASQHVLVASF